MLIPNKVEETALWKKKLKEEKKTTTTWRNAQSESGRFGVCVGIVLKITEPPPPPPPPPLPPHTHSHSHKLQKPGLADPAAHSAVISDATVLL